MSRTVSYARQTHDSPNPLTRFAHRSRYKISLELADRLLPRAGAVLDFGAGEGTFLQRLRVARPDARLLAVEPYMTIAAEEIEQLGSITQAPSASVDLIGAFEVLEHVSDEGLDDFLANARRVLKPGGTLLVTVPIMYGLALPAKELSRSLLHRRWGDTGPIEMAKGTLGLPIARTPTRLQSHKGFDFRVLRNAIAADFTVAEERYSPLSSLPWWVNSQAIFIAK